MKPKTRFVQSVTLTARQCKTVLPWTRGARRAAFIEKRKNGALVRKSA